MIACTEKSGMKMQANMVVQLSALSCQLSVKAYALNHDDEDDDKGF
jgi:hypothetical protein